MKCADLVVHKNEKSRGRICDNKHKLSGISLHDLGPLLKHAIFLGLPTACSSSVHPPKFKSSEKENTFFLFLRNSHLIAAVPEWVTFSSHSPRLHRKVFFQEWGWNCYPKKTRAQLPEVVVKPTAVP